MSDRTNEIQEAAQPPVKAWTRHQGAGFVKWRGHNRTAIVKLPGTMYRLFRTDGTCLDFRTARRGEAGRGPVMSPTTFEDSMKHALRVIDECGASMQAAIDTIKENGNVVSDQLLDRIVDTHESVANLARGIIGASLLTWERS